MINHLLAFRYDNAWCSLKKKCKNDQKPPQTATRTVEQASKREETRKNAEKLLRRGYAGKTKRKKSATSDMKNNSAGDLQEKMKVPGTIIRRAKGEYIDLTSSRFPDESKLCTEYDISHRHSIHKRA